MGRHVTCAALGARAVSRAVVEALEARRLLAIYYVSPAGSDAWAGTSPQTPWQTLERVNQHNFSPGDQILLQAGATFTGNLAFDASDAGAPGAPVKIGTYASTAGFQEVGGKVEFEAEHSTGQSPGTGAAAGHAWSLINDSSASGGTALVASPNTGLNTGENLIGPRRDYSINFANTGTYYVWVRLNGASGADDSAHIGLNGQATSLGGVGVTTGNHGQWVWLNQGGSAPRLTVNVAAPGVHTFNLWMREDGTKIDRFILSRDASFNPGSPGGNTFQETGGRVDMEAEAFTGQSPGTGAAAGHTWSLFNDASASGGRGIVASPNSGVNTGDNLIGPRRDYAINFTNTGTYYVWVRLNGAGGDDDSVHVGLNGQATSLGGVGVTTGNHGQWVWLNQGGSASRLTLNVTTAGIHTFNLWMREDGTKIDQLTLTRNAGFTPGANHFQESGGRVDMEAEAFTGQSPGTGAAAGHGWSLFDDAGASGERGIVASPNSGLNTGEALIGPRRDYAINFSNTGTYYVWVRLNGASGDDDSVHVGLNGQAVSLGRSGVTTGNHGQWIWLNTGGAAARLTVNVATPGVHAFNLWMREDGTRIDQFILTKDAGFVPGTGSAPPAPITPPGRAKILSGDTHGLIIRNAGWFEISNLNLVGSGHASNLSEGIWAYSTLSGNAKLEHLYIDNVETRGYGRNGIAIGGYVGATGFRDVRVTNSIARENGINGLHVFGSALGSHEDVYIGNVRAIGNPGVAGAPWVSGSGILLQSVKRGTVERSVATNNGYLGKGGIGIWTYYSDQIVIQHNESYNNRTSGTSDGGGFGLDGGTTNSILQYNYSHGNDGAGYGLYQFNGATAWGNNIVRYNISENDGRRNSYASIQAWNGNGGNGLNGAQIYHNTVYLSPASHGLPSGLRFSTGTINFSFRNNIFVTTGGARLLHDNAANVHTNLLFQGNNYFSSGGEFVIGWSGTTYSSLSSWRSATGQERLNGFSVGFSVDPRFTAPGAGGTIGDAGLLGNLTAYKLRPDSAMINGGLDIASLFGQTPVRDFFGTAVPAGGSYDLGAHEWVG